MKNILITSFGTSWPIVPELIGFTNPNDYDLYKNHPLLSQIQKQRTEYRLEPINEIWLATTNGSRVGDEIGELKEWLNDQDLKIKLRIFSYKTLVELDTIEEIDLMADLIYRVVLKARSEIEGGKLYLSLAGGRKNMSANMQSAAEMFGCDALIHVMSKEYSDIHNDFKKNNSFKAFFNIPGKEIECFFPFVLSGKKEASNLMYVDPELNTIDFTINEVLENENSTNLLYEINKRLNKSSNSLFNLYKSLNRKESQNSFAAFQMLHPSTRNKLKEEKIGADPILKEKDLEWLKEIPKADLHCHFGGILSPKEMIEVAQVNKKDVQEAINTYSEFRKWFQDLKSYIGKENLKELKKYNPKNIRKEWSDKGIKEPLAISAFLILFEGEEHSLQKIIYQQIKNFKGIGIDSYERLGDFQGSSLMQNEVSIRKACQILKRNCREHNIEYLEVRCSPENYTRGGLRSEQVVKIMIDELQSSETIFKLIFIASRHNDTSLIKKHIELAKSLLKNNNSFRDMFVGFDLAGAEDAARPAKLRNEFLSIMEKSIPTTIHAGENMPAKNIWEAVYHLSAERIGHGLSLNEDEDLKNRIKERKIAIEMCPSSNDQIIGFHDYCHNGQKKFTKEYPLKTYFDDGLKVTINTDDPGISLTNITNEYYKAACLTKGGLSKWEILQINRNGFKYGFLALEEKKQLLLAVEHKLFKLLNNE